MKIKPYKIAFDIDGVVANFLPIFLRVLKEDEDIELSLKDITNFELSVVDLPKKELRKAINKAVNNPIKLGMKMMPGSKDVLINLLCICSVYLVTARKNGRLIKQWIDNELGFDSDIIVIAMNGHNKKAEALKRRGITHFVDDRLETCYQLKEAGITPILFTCPHNACNNTFMRVNNWADIDKLINWK